MNILSPVNQNLDNFYQIQTKCYQNSDTVFFFQFTELNEARCTQMCEMSLSGIMSCITHSDPSLLASPAPAPSALSSTFQRFQYTHQETDSIRVKLSHQITNKPHTTKPMFRSPQNSKFFHLSPSHQFLAACMEY
jgi:hypothetical protein